MSRRYSNKCLRYAVYITALCVLSAGSARAQGESASPLPSVSAPPDSSQSVDYVRTHSADYVRKPTDPPPFNPNSQAAEIARATASQEKARPKPKPVRDDAVVQPQMTKPKIETEFEPGMETSARPPARPARREPTIATPATEPRRADPGPAPADPRPAIDPRPAPDSQPASQGADRPAATSLSWPSGEGTDPAPAAAAPDAPGVAPTERWTDPWGDQPAAPGPRPTTGSADPWADPPVAAPRPRPEAPTGDAPMPSQLDTPPETDPPGPPL